MKSIVPMNGDDELDEEWLILILTAREMGIPLKEIRLFLTQSSEKSTAKMG